MLPERESGFLLFMSKLTANMAMLSHQCAATSASRQRLCPVSPGRKGDSRVRGRRTSDQLITRVSMGDVCV